MKSGHRSSGDTLKSVGSSLRFLCFATDLRVTRRSPRREGDFRLFRTDKDYFHHRN